MPKLQPSSSLSQLTKPAQSNIDLPGVGILAGSTQHLKNLGKVVGAKVNDFLRRRDTDRNDIGLTEVNKTVASVLSNKEKTVSLGDEEMSKFVESFPRLDPPPPVVKKRVPRALKTTQDMIISPNPVLNSPEKTTICTEVSLNDNSPTLKCQPDSLPNGREEDIILEQTEIQNGVLPEIALSVPDIIHKESMDTNVRESSHFHEKAVVKLCISQEDLIEGEINHSDWSSWPKNSTLDGDGPHPDLLSFE
ncbi:unnamed protein product [Staurois parvus]|uniref:Uncharacterized protein n=1 Tax=Staurois parvus TaxID=386267 RepID=A0ABN9F337_9NEOB|nr:unnamed protein product [Staurois parvus]